MKASAIIHNLFVQQHTVPKSWLSLDDLIDADWEGDLDADLYLSTTVTMCNLSDAARREEVHNFLSAKLQ